MAVFSIVRKLPRYMTSPRGGVPAGLRPSYNIDFTRNRADIGGKITTIADIPSISGTLALSSSGHLVSGASNGLIIPLTGVTYPLTFLVEFVRNTDTGGNEFIAGLITDDNNAAYYRIDTGDQVRRRIDTAGVNQCNIGGGSTISSVPTAVQRAAGRAATNDAQNCRNGTLGTADTSVTLPSSPVELRIGIDTAGTQTFTGLVRKIKIYPVAATNAQLQALTTVA